jgi:hypothetical protein
MERIFKMWARLRGVIARSQVESEIEEELRAHLSLRTDANIAAGMSAEEAARDAGVRFGGIEAIKEACRDVRGGGTLDVLIQDTRFAMRMFRKYPAVSIVSVIGMSVAIAVAAGYFTACGAFLNPKLPISDGDRIMSIQNVDVRDGKDLQTARDFVAWRDALKSVTELSAFDTARRNLLVPSRAVERVDVAEITASGLRLAQTAPVLGRSLLDDDERDGAPPVVVIAYEEWQRVFGGMPDIIGQTVRLGREVYTVVGVMPEGFRFPVNHHYWVPLRLRLADIETGAGPSLSIFGRLMEGATPEAAQAELTVVNLRMAATHPDSYEHVRARVLPYTYPFMGIDTPETAMMIRAIQLAIGLLLVLVAANVAILVYARVATRTGEIAVRTALGAGRPRLVAQLFVEAFVLSATAAAIGADARRVWTRRRPICHGVRCGRATSVLGPSHPHPRCHRLCRCTRAFGWRHRRDHSCAEGNQAKRAARAPAIVGPRVAAAARPHVDYARHRAGRHCRRDSPVRDLRRWKIDRPWNCQAGLPGRRDPARVC